MLLIGCIGVADDDDDDVSCRGVSARVLGPVSLFVRCMRGGERERERVSLCCDACVWMEVW